MRHKLLISFLCITFITTGCFFGEVGSGYITKTCTKTTTHGDVTIIETKEIKSKDNNIVSISFTNSLESSKSDFIFRSIRNSYISEMNELNSRGINTKLITDIEGNYEVSYLFDFDSIDDDIKNKYNFEKLNHNQIKKYEQEGYECK